jgi:hypothetical protein
MAPHSPTFFPTFHDHLGRLPAGGRPNNRCSFLLPAGHHAGVHDQILKLLSYRPDLNGLLRFYQTNEIQESRGLDLTDSRSRAIMQQWGAQFAKLLSPLL